MDRRFQAAMAEIALSTYRHNHFEICPGMVPFWYHSSTIQLLLRQINYPTTVRKACYRNMASIMAVMEEGYSKNQTTEMKT